VWINWFADYLCMTFYTNADTYELGLGHLSTPALEGSFVLGGSTEDMVE
jgi:hypothetical protein